MPETGLNRKRIVGKIDYKMRFFLRFIFLAANFFLNLPFFSALTDSFRKRLASFSKSMVPTLTRCAADLFPLYTLFKSATTSVRREFSCVIVSFKAIEKSPIPAIHFLGAYIFLNNFLKIISQAISKFYFFRLSNQNINGIEKL